jgi:hypothetical protein
MLTPLQDMEGRVAGAGRARRWAVLEGEDLELARPKPGSTGWGAAMLRHYKEKRRREGYTVPRRGAAVLAPLRDVENPSSRERMANAVDRRTGGRATGELD